jgi:hypothetical protein
MRCGCRTAIQLKLPTFSQGNEIQTSFTQWVIQSCARHLFKRRKAKHLRLRSKFQLRIKG